MSILLLILGILLFIGLVVVHEFGHFIVARRNGVDVEEFGIGFPPRAWSRKTKKGFLFSLNWLPIGGFVKLKGENDAATEKGSFGAASLKIKAKIMLAGVAMNLVVAWLFFTIVALAGMPQLIDNQFTIASDTKVVRSDVLVALIVKDSPAEKAGLHLRDQLISIQPLGAGGVQDGQAANADVAALPKTIDRADKLSEITKQYAGQRVLLAYKREGQAKTAVIQLRSETEVKDKAYLGIVPTDYILQRSTWSAPIVALGLIKQFTVVTLQGLGTLFNALFHGDAAKAGQQVTGPVGIVAVLKQGSLLGYEFVLFWVGLISFSLALMNVMPIPALDGGRFYVLVLSRLFKKKLSKDMEERIVGTSFIFLIGLIILITIVDVRRFL